MTCDLTASWPRAFLACMPLRCCEVENPYPDIEENDARRPLLMMEGRAGNRNATCKNHQVLRRPRLALSSPTCPELWQWHMALV